MNICWEVPAVKKWRFTTHRINGIFHLCERLQKCRRFIIQKTHHEFVFQIEMGKYVQAYAIRISALL